MTLFGTAGIIAGLARTGVSLAVVAEARSHNAVGGAEKGPESNEAGTEDAEEKFGRCPPYDGNESIYDQKRRSVVKNSSSTTESDLQDMSSVRTWPKNTSLAMLATSVKAPMPKIAVSPSFCVQVMLSRQIIDIGRRRRMESVVMLNAAFAT